MNPVAPEAPIKASPFFSQQPGQLFSTQPKSEPTPVSDSWPFRSSLALDSQPKSSPLAGLSAPSPAQASSAAASQDYRTVNLSDLFGFSFPGFSSGQEAGSKVGAADGGGGGGGIGAGLPEVPPHSEPGSSFGAIGSGVRFRTDHALGDEELNEFPSLTDGHVSGTLDSINTEEFQALLGTSALVGDGGVGLGNTSGSCALPQSSSTVSSNPHTTPNLSAGNNICGATWMNYPNSIMSLLQTEGMMEGPVASSINLPVLDDLDDLSSMDEDRLMSILNSGTTPSFMSGRHA